MMKMSDSNCSDLMTIDYFNMNSHTRDALRKHPVSRREVSIPLKVFRYKNSSLQSL